MIPFDLPEWLVPMFTSSLNIADVLLAISGILWVALYVVVFVSLLRTTNRLEETRSQLDQALNELEKVRNSHHLDIAFYEMQIDLERQKLERILRGHDQ